MSFLEATSNRNKRLTERSFKQLTEKNGFIILKFKYWAGKKGMKIFAKKL